MLQGLRPRIDVFDSLVDTVLADILAWEFVAAGDTSLQRDSKVHKVDVLLSVVAHVLDESVEVVSLRHAHTAVLVVRCLC
jgi:hypothetical protein